MRFPGPGHEHTGMTDLIGFRAGPGVEKIDAQFRCHCEERSDEAISCFFLRGGLLRSLRSLAITILI